MWGPFKLLTGMRRKSRIPTESEFRAIIERERNRADRTATLMALVAFQLDSRESGQRLERLTTTFQHRLRSTDDFGLLSGDRIGVVLPDTDAQGGWTVATDISHLVQETVESLACEVYQYPDPDTRPIGGSHANEDESRSAVGYGASRPVRPMVELFCRPLPTWKRAIDVLAAASGLLLLLPLFMLSALLVKVSSSGPVMFRQRRSGIGGRPFYIYKFRSMVANAEAQKAALRKHSEQDGPAFKMKQDPRVTKVGKFLRTTSLDELPQLWNLLVGDMTLVGPRPLPCDESAACLRWQQRRLDVTPGITCIWQVEGRSRVPFIEWMRMDQRYIRNRNPMLDLKLVLATVPSVLLRRGAS